jgi:hypothetical protein
MLASFKIHRNLRGPAQGRVDPLARDVSYGERVGIQERGQRDHFPRSSTRINESTVHPPPQVANQRINESTVHPSPQVPFQRIRIHEFLPLLTIQTLKTLLTGTY